MGLLTITCSLDIYGVSSQQFDTSLKPLLFLTKFNRTNLVVFAFSTYNFAETQNNLQSPDFQDFRFSDVCPGPEIHALVVMLLVLVLPQPISGPAKLYNFFVLS